jgi:hypothetical protein
MGAEFTNVYARRYGSQRNVAVGDRRPNRTQICRRGARARRLIRGDGGEQ